MNTERTENTASTEATENTERTASTENTESVEMVETMVEETPKVIKKLVPVSGTFYPPNGKEAKMSEKVPTDVLEEMIGDEFKIESNDGSLIVWNPSFGAEMGLNEFGSKLLSEKYKEGRVVYGSVLVCTPNMLG